jgi:hypothetical protein
MVQSEGYNIIFSVAEGERNRSALHKIARYPKIRENEKIQNCIIAEIFCRRVLDNSPGVCATAKYAYLKTVSQVNNLLEEASKDSHVPNFIVFPEVWVCQYRVDYIIAA